MESKENIQMVGGKVNANNKAKINGENMENSHFFSDEKLYGKEYRKHLLEQYKLCVQMADKISSRRCSANNFFLSVNTLFLTAIGILSKLGFEFSLFNISWIIIVSFSGILLCWTWLVTIRCYRNLNEAKFEIINRIEEKLPVKAFETEWALLTGERKTDKYPHLTRVERWVPRIFSFLYLVLIFLVFLSTLFQRANLIYGF